MRRYADRRDTNEPEIISYLTRLGCKVKPISQKSIPDLLVSGGPLDSFVVLFEIKNKNGTLTDDQEVFFKQFGQSFVYVVRSRTDVKKVIRLFRPVRVYHCDTCGVIEKEESFSQKPLTKCPICDKLFKRVYSIPRILTEKKDVS
ncbi:MAG: hypothetical protein WC196_04500 [Bacilli bacterium]|jgi:putative FmdB family regulatory protein